MLVKASAMFAFAGLALVRLKVCLRSASRRLGGLPPGFAMPYPGELLGRGSRGTACLFIRKGFFAMTNKTSDDAVNGTPPELVSGGQSFAGQIYSNSREVRLPAGVSDQYFNLISNVTRNSRMMVSVCEIHGPGGGPFMGPAGMQVMNVAPDEFNIGWVRVKVNNTWQDFLWVKFSFLWWE
jgi:hypothetical protein